MEISNQDKLKLIHFLNFICDYEASKPLEEMDEELIDACVKVSLELQNKRVNHSPEFIDEQVRKIFREGEEEKAVPEAEKIPKKVVSKKKIWLVAACIAILVALFSVISFSSERSVVDILEDFFGTYEFIPFGKEVDVGEETYVKYSQSRKYLSIEDAVNTEKITLLKFSVPNANELTNITFYSKQEKASVMYIYNDPDFSVNISCNGNLTEEIKTRCKDIVVINETTYYLISLDEPSQTQAYFIHRNNLYTVAYPDRDLLIDILKNMEEVRYES